MKLKLEDITLLDAYINGHLNISEVRNIEERLKTDKELQDNLETLKKVKRDARVFGLKQTWNQIQSYESEHITNEKSPEKSSKKGKWLYSIVAGCVLLMILLAIWFWNQNQKKYPQEYADIFEKRFEREMILHVTYRSTQQDTQLTKQQKQAYDLYALKEFKTATPMLKSLWETERDTLALYYWGISELGVGHVNKSREILSDPALIRYNISFIHKSKTK